MNINTFLQEQYHKDIPSLFEAVYRKETVVVEEKLLAILEDVLRRYPQKPTQEDKAVRKDVKALELLGNFFDQTIGVPIV